MKYTDNDDNYQIMIILGHCVLLWVMNDISMKNSMLLNKFWVMEAFLSFGKYNNFQSDKFLYNSGYSNFSCDLKNRWMNN